MYRQRLKTRQQVAVDLGISYSTLYRKLKKSNLELNGNLLPPHKVAAIRNLFGYHEDDVGDHKI